MEPTADQLAAIRTEGRPLLVEAGAGTGKTWVLVRRFLHLLENHPNWPLESVVAVTFTEKAAREMRTRIRHEVEQAASGAPPGSPWQARRRELDRLQVSTIHSLCARLLRENALEAGVDPRFTVLDEQETGLLKEEAPRQALAELAGSDRDGGAPELALLASLRVRDLSEQLAELLDKRGTVYRLFAGLPGPDALLEAWQTGIAKRRGDLWAELMQEDPELEPVLAGLAKTPISDPTDKLAPSLRLAQSGCQAQAGGDLAAACASWLDIKLTGGIAANWGGKDGLALLKSRLRKVREAAGILQEAGCALDPGSQDAAAAAALQLWRGLWERVEDIYSRLKAARHALDFDDLELRAAALLDQAPRGARLHAVLEGVNHLMVDEFQDTNEIQQRIVYGLAHPTDAGRLFVVGDAKQSIYRFRQSQVTVFNRTAQDIAAASGSDPVRLSRSFRTHEPLVRASNDLFDRLLQPFGRIPQGYEAVPGPLTAERPAPPAFSLAPAPVEILLLPAEDSGGKSISAQEARIYEAQLLGRRLLELYSGGFEVWDKEQTVNRPFRFDDAAILFRATTDLPLYEEQFKALGLPYLTVSGRGYYDRPEVKDLVALLTCLYNPADDLNLAAVLRSPLFSLSDETLYHLRWNAPLEPGASAASPGEPAPFYKALRQPPPTAQPEAVAFAGEVLAELWGLAGRVGVWALLRAALDRTGYEAVLAVLDREAGGGRAYNNVQKLLELARTGGPAGGATSLAEFLRRVEDLRAREAREGEALGAAPAGGAVQLLSIHAAKGLEFPVTIVADLGRSKRRAGGSPRLLFDPAFGLVCQIRNPDSEDWEKPAGYGWAEWLFERMEAAEAKRLLYVACTRAADLLILSGKPGGGSGKAASWLQDILQAWQIPPSGELDELLSREGFDLRVLRPPYAPQDTARDELPDETVSVLAGAAGLPPLACPLPEPAQPVMVAVTDLARLLDPAGDELSLLRPAVNPADGPGGAPAASAPSFRVGRLVHRALANWPCLSLPPQELDVLLAAYARREGILDPGSVNGAVRQARRLLANLRGAPIYARVQAAVERHRELPFSLDSQFGSLQGVIDLLFRESDGEWQLVDWKTEWAPPGGLDTLAASHRLQMAVYAAAARRALGKPVTVSICFLSSGARVYTFPPGDLETVWEEIGIEHGLDG
jgi:ATP-dependent helicase/nuclease subunit A